jgi:L-alanine-DL-glutamate epimerase-like enolase superfamily enzyme
MRHPFTITHGTTTLQQNVLVELTDGQHTGYGEAPSTRTYALAKQDILYAVLEEARHTIENTPLTTPEAYWEALRPALEGNTFAQCAVDQAATDLWGKRLGKPVWQLWGLNLDRYPDSDYTIGLDTLEKMVTKLLEFPGWPIYKIKLGTDQDVEIIRELRRHTDAVFRIDANTAWTAEQTLAYAPQLAELGVEFLEQPLRRDDWSGMAELKGRCALPVIADESCLVEADVQRCAEFFDGINIKLSKAGGLTPARRMIAEGRSLGLKIMAGCMNESTVGISAIGMLLPLLDYVDMDGSVLIAEDVAQGVHLVRGRPQFPSTPGNGVTLLPHMLA